MIKLAKKNLRSTNAHIVLADIRSLPFREQSFDFVLCEADPISQCGSKDEAIRALRSLYDVLKKGSMLIGSLTNRYFWIIKLAFESKDSKYLKRILNLISNGIYKPKRGYRMYLFTIEEFMKEVSALGFQIVKISPYTGLIISQFLPQGNWYLTPSSKRVLSKIESTLEKYDGSIYFSRRFRFALKKS
jgi:ubiquinone/menaquinone biosynthesis C-methylase UbiE